MGVSNFLYLPGSPSGWNQSHYYQYLKNTNDIKVLNNNQFEYNDAIRNIVVQNGLTSFGTGELIGYSVDFSTYAASVKPWEYVKEGIAIAILDTVRDLIL
ncbi:MAG: hypothetical protein IPN72_18830 [Saprospiraceae bacterium]|nr:hypothetical protein [Saprospiraceae bacterium]